MNRQIQKGGSEANQIQIGTYVVQCEGISEQRTREIINEMAPELFKLYSREAFDLIQQRMDRYTSESLIPKLVEQELLDSLKNPDIQRVLRETLEEAVTTDCSDDYSTLTELLIQKIENRDNRMISAGVRRAIGIVNDISDEALTGITVAYELKTFIPAVADINGGLSVYNDLFSGIIKTTLPEGVDWLKHLDMLNAIRYSEFGGMKKVEEVFPNRVGAYIEPGIPVNSSNYEKALEMIQSVGLPTTILIKHELREGYVRLRIAEINSFDEMSITVAQVVSSEGKQIAIPVTIPLNEEQIDTVKQIYLLYDHNEMVRSENARALMDLWNTFDSLRKVREWWNSMKGIIDITPAGEALAHANSRRHYSAVPDFSLYN